MDYQNSQTIPFESADYNHGLKVAKGLLKLNPKGIELEYQVQDSFVGVFKSDVKNILVSYKDLESIHFKKGWFSDKISLKTSSLQLMQELPGTEQGECVLKVKRKHREEARQTISQARIGLSEQKLDQLGEHGEE
jgi:hypothetical protein